MARPHSCRAALLGGGVSLVLFPVALAAQTEAEALSLDTIVVDSKREVQTGTAAALTVIDQEEIDDRQAGTIAELIDSVPGVTLVNGATPAGSGINIRGFGSTGSYGSNQKVLIQVDGATQGSEELYRIGTQLFTDPELYRSVSVLRGTIGSFEYGSGVVGGIVRLETKNASDFTGGEIGLRVRPFALFSTNGDGFVASNTIAWQPTQNLEILGNYTWRKQDEQDDGDGNPVGAHGFELPSWLVKGRYSFGRSLDHSVTLTHSETRSQDRDVPYDSFGTTTDAFGNVDRDIASTTTSVAYAYDPTGNDLVNVEAQLSYADQQIDSSYVEGSSSLESNPVFGPTIRGLGDADHRYETTQFVAKNTAWLNFAGATHELRTGIELSRRERAEMPAAPGGEDDRVAVFVVNDMDFGNGFSLSPAVRYETQKIDQAGYGDASYSNDALMGGLAARYEWRSGFAVFASVAYTEALPIIDDLETPLYMEQSEKARTYEVGASYDAGGLIRDGDALALKGNLYLTDVWDVTSHSGVAEIEQEGFELEAAYSLENGFYADLNAHLADYVGTSAAGIETPFSGMPADRARLALGKRFDRELDVSWEMVANRRVDETATPSPGVTVHNLRATYRAQSGFLEGTELRVSLENLFDKAYLPHLATRNAPGRNVKFGLAKTF